MEFAARVLRDVQNQWLLSEAAFPHTAVTAVILRIFAFDFHATGFLGYRGVTQRELAARSVDDWVAIVGSPLDECAAFLPFLVLQR